MAKKILKTQIQLRYDTWENWSDESVPNQKGNLVLLQGEVGILTYPIMLILFIMLLQFYLK